MNNTQILIEKFKDVVEETAPSNDDLLTASVGFFSVILYIFKLSPAETIELLALGIQEIKRLEEKITEN